MKNKLNCNRRIQKKKEKKRKTCLTLFLLVLIGTMLIGLTGCTGTKDEPMKTVLISTSQIDSETSLICENVPVVDADNGKSFFVTEFKLYRNGVSESAIQLDSGSFYDIRFDTEQINNSSFAEIPDFCSSVSTVSGKQYVVIYVMPGYQDLDTPPAYTESPFYGVTPKDTLNTEPILIQDDAVYDGYPVWLFVLDPTLLTDDYRVVYGDFYLSGSQILGT